MQITIHQIKGLEGLCKQLLDENAALKTQIAALKQFITSEFLIINNNFQSFEDAKYMKTVELKNQNIMASRIVVMNAAPIVQLDTSGFALKSDIPTMPNTSGFALKSDIPTMPDTSGFALKSDIPTMPDTSNFPTRVEVSEKIESAKGEILVTEETKNQFIKDVMANADNQIGSRLNELDVKYNDLEPRIKDCEEDLVNQSQVNEQLRVQGYLYIPTVMSIENIGIYNNLRNGNVTMERRLPNNKITVPHVAITSIGQVDPGFGGFYHGFVPKPNTAYMVEVAAQIPVGRRIYMTHSNSIDAIHFTPMTPMVGTGGFEKYKIEIHAGANPSSSTGFYAIHDGEVPTPENPLEWIVTKADVFELPPNWK